MSEASGADHYRVLGVSPDASRGDIRRAFRAAARAAHPDIVGRTNESAARRTADVRRMAEINDAWSVLSDPDKRRAYDHARGAGGGSASASERSTRPVDDHPRPPIYSGPARIPWRAMRWMLVVGVVIVLLLSVVSTPSEPSRPDQLLQTGSCVVIDETDAVSEVSCDDEHDAVVRQLVAFDKQCPVGTQTHRDRQGMGWACVEPPLGSVNDGG